MPVKLYCTIISPPVRAVIHTLQALDVQYELVNVNFLQGECLTEEFLKLNPQHTVPTIQDEDGFVIWESHAINAYLVNKYGKNDALYPKDPKARAIVDQRLHFDNGVLFTKFITVAKKILKEKTITKITDEWKTFIEEGYDFLEKFLVGNQYVAGDGITIADFSILTTLCNSSVFVPVNSGKYPLIADYVKRSEANILGFKQLESEGKEKFLEILKSLNFEFMAVTVYYSLHSPPCRAVLFTLTALNITHEKQFVNLRKQEQLVESFIKINPHHTIPTIKDGDFVLWESHAIDTYLANKYDKTHQFYPKEPTKRAIVDQQLHFEHKKIFSVFEELVKELKKGSKSVSKGEREMVASMYQFLEGLFQNSNKYISGDSITIADFSLIPTVTTVDLFVRIDKVLYPKLFSYIKLCESTFPDYQAINNAGLEDFKQWLAIENYNASVFSDE
ncbi:uncharacterized protein LOC135834946 [Planococcus citri]|uniref:uncharacterized protein LOC135834946 n=1 Tax=Planococcus citri TaxID=170843 RepID=UPI0031F8D3AE